MTTNAKHRITALLTGSLAASFVCAGCAQDFEDEDGYHALEQDEFDDAWDEDIDELESEEFDEEDEEEGEDEGEDAWDDDAIPELPVDEFAADTDTMAALGDFSCVTSGQTDVEYQWGCNLLGGESCFYLTPDTSYHDDYNSGEVCQPYQTLKTQTVGMNSTVSMTHWAAWRGAAPSNESACERSHIEMAAYEFDQNGGHWRLVGTRDRRGTWNTSSSSCFFGWVTIPNTATCNSLGKCQNVHAVTARAYTENTYWFPTANRVYLGTYRN